MIVETEPADLLMLRYKLYFNQQRPDPEDAWVLAYFEEWGLKPRRVLQEEHDGIPYKVLHFGQCYLGRHLNELGKLYQRGIEHSVLAQHIQTTLVAEGQPAFTALPVDTVQTLLTTLAAQLHAQASFESRDNTLCAVLAADIIQEAFMVWQKATTPEAS